MTIRVLNLITSFNPGGIERWLISMLKAMDRSRVVMDFCCKTLGPNLGPLLPQVLDLGAQVFHCPLRPTHLGFLRTFTKIIQEGKYQILHNHLELYSGVGVYAAKKCGIPVITNFHNTGFPPQVLPNWAWLVKLRDIYGTQSIRYAVRNSDLVIGDCQATLDYINGISPIPPGRGKILHYGVQLSPPMEDAERQAFRKELGLAPEWLVITHVGRFVTQKNHEGLVRIAEKVIAQDSRAHFVLVGDGSLRGGIEDMAKGRNLASSFSFLGIRSDVERILGVSDIFFLPSLWEGIPVVVLEAMASALPVVGSDLPEMREVVTDGETGVLWPVHDEVGLAQQILYLMANPNTRRLLGEAGLRRVEEEFTLQKGAERLYHVYESFSHS